MVGGVPAPPEAPGNLSGSADADRTVTLGWSRPRGEVTSFRLEAGSAPRLANIATIDVGENTTVSFPGVPPGSYWVRVRAVNSRGVSVASTDFKLVVR